MYRVFTRVFWKHNPDYPNGLEPHLGRKHTLKKNVETLKEAQAIAREYNDTHDPGPLSRKAEIERQRI